jgi:hypothetical protein
MQVRPNPNFNAEAAANELRAAMKGLGNARDILVIIVVVFGLILENHVMISLIT